MTLGWETAEQSARGRSAPARASHATLARATWTMRTASPARTHDGRGSLRSAAEGEAAQRGLNTSGTRGGGRFRRRVLVDGLGGIVPVPFAAAPLEAVVLADRVTTFEPDVPAAVGVEATMLSVLVTAAAVATVVSLLIAGAASELRFELMFIQNLSFTSLDKLQFIILLRDR